MPSPPIEMRYPCCSECGSKVSLLPGPGRTRSLEYGKPLPIPEFYAIPTCTKCGETSMSLDISQELDHILTCLYYSQSKVIFLDIDGVLNATEDEWDTSADLWWSADHLDQDKIERLNKIIEVTGAVVVLSSSWRTKHNLNTMRGMLEHRGFKGFLVGDTPVLRRTPDGVQQTRGDEIQAWVKAMKPSRFIVLDDEPVPGLASHHINTGDSGLQDVHVTIAINLLSR